MFCLAKLRSYNTLQWPQPAGQPCVEGLGDPSLGAPSGSVSRVDDQSSTLKNSALKRTALPQTPRTTVKSSALKRTTLP